MTYLISIVTLEIWKVRVASSVFAEVEQGAGRACQGSWGSNKPFQTAGLLCKTTLNHLDFAVTPWAGQGNDACLCICSYIQFTRDFGQHTPLGHV